MSTVRAVGDRRALSRFCPFIGLPSRSSGGLLFDGPSLPAASDRQGGPAIIPHPPSLPTHRRLGGIAVTASVPLFQGCSPSYMAQPAPTAAYETESWRWIPCVRTSLCVCVCVSRYPCARACVSPMSLLLTLVINSSQWAWPSGGAPNHKQGKEGARKLPDMDHFFDAASRVRTLFSTSF